jgi:succinate-acetate transporter protein
MAEKMANPAALGLACFALTTFLLSVLNAGLASKELLSFVVSCALIYGGAVQIIAGVLDIRAGSTFGGTAFSSYGGFWICLGLALLLEFLGVYVLTQAAIGIFLLAWTLFTFYMWVGTFRLNWALVRARGCQNRQDEGRREDRDAKERDEAPNFTLHLQH